MWDILTESLLKHWQKIIRIIINLIIELVSKILAVSFVKYKKERNKSNKSNNKFMILITNIIISWNATGA